MKIVKFNNPVWLHTIYEYQYSTHSVYCRHIVYLIMHVLRFKINFPCCIVTAYPYRDGTATGRKSGVFTHQPADNLDNSDDLDNSHNLDNFDDSGVTGNKEIALIFVIFRCIHAMKVT